MDFTTDQVNKIILFIIALISNETKESVHYSKIIS